MEPSGTHRKKIDRTIGDRIAALQPFPIDLHQIHTGAGGFSRVRTEVAVMAQLAKAGKIGAVGVSNFSARQMKIAHATLAEQGLSLATNQIQINLLHRKIETNGVLDAARRLGVTLIAYSPLASGDVDRQVPRRSRPARRHTAGASVDQRSPPKRLARTAPLIESLARSRPHQASVSQVALAWLITNYGDTVVALPGASKPHHAEEAAGALKVTLAPDESARLAELDPVKPEL